jgi:putative multicomponent Na+:H+ antiporter subunit B
MNLNTDPVTTCLLVSLLFFAVMIVFTRKLIHAVIYMSTFSTVAATVFLFLGAPDVALAEAVIGSTISTIVFLIAIKKHRIFMLYVVNNPGRPEPVRQGIRELVQRLEEYCREREIQQFLINTDDEVEGLLARDEQKVVLESRDEAVILHADAKNVHTLGIRDLIDRFDTCCGVKLSLETVRHDLPYREAVPHEKV